MGCFLFCVCFSQNLLFQIWFDYLASHSAFLVCSYVTMKGRAEKTLDKEEGEEHVMEEARELRRGARPKIPNSKLKDFYWHKE